MNAAVGSAAGSIGVPLVGAPAPGRPRNVVEAAQQFEALMIGELLKAARSDESGWLGSGEETGDATAAGLAEEQFAQALAKSGGLGLSAQITASLSENK